MSDLVVIGFEEDHMAFEMRAELVKLQKEYLINMEEALGIISSVHAVMDTRTTQGTIAWVISLNTFPYIAVPAYWILGRSRFKGYVKAHRASEQHISGQGCQLLRQGHGHN